MWSVVHQSGKIKFVTTRKGVKKYLRSQPYASVFAVFRESPRFEAFQAIAGGDQPVTMSVIRDLPTLTKWHDLLREGASESNK